MEKVHKKLDAVIRHSASLKKTDDFHNLAKTGGIAKIRTRDGLALPLSRLVKLLLIVVYSNALRKDT